MLLDNSHSYFVTDEVSDEIIQRITEHDIHPSGTLWGKGELLSRGDIKETELTLTKIFPLFTAGLEEKGLKQERRALRLSVHDLECDFVPEENIITFSFYLPAGGYATSVLRELVIV
jgi:tRNA pseudouridine13 synthase